MKHRTRTIAWAGGLTVLALGTGSFFWLRQSQREQQLERGVPTTPAALARWPAEFRQRIESAAKSVRAGDKPAAALAELAMLYHANGFLEEASRCYEALEQAGNADAISLYRHGMILSGYGSIDAAAARFQEVIRLAPDYIPARVRLGDLRLKENDLSGASASYGAALQKDPNQLHALLGMARCEMEREEWAEARRHLETVVQQSEYALGYDLIVTVYEKLGLQAEAATVRGATKSRGTYHDMSDPWMETLQGMGFDPAQLALTSATLRSAGNSDQARQLLERALRFAPEDAKLHFQLGLIFSQQRDYTAARTELTRCTELAPDFADGWVHLYDVLYSLGMPAEAQRVFNEGLRHCPDSYGLNLMRARDLKGRGKLREAIPFFEKVISIRPTEPDAYIDLGVTQFGLGNTEAGLEQFRRALVAEPGNPTVLSSMAFYAIKSGDAPAAADWIRQCGEQPRVSRDELRRLIDLYRQAFPGR